MVGICSLAYGLIIINDEKLNITLVCILIIVGILILVLFFYLDLFKFKNHIFDKRVMNSTMIRCWCLNIFTGISYYGN